MGCDIHAVVEKRVSNGKWVTVNTLTNFHKSHRRKEESDCAFPAVLLGLAWLTKRLRMW